MIGQRVAIGVGRAAAVQKDTGSGGDGAIDPRRGYGRSVDGADGHGGSDTVDGAVIDDQLYEVGASLIGDEGWANRGGAGESGAASGGNIGDGP